LLNCGFPLRSALELARSQSFVGGQYLVVGDGRLAIAQVDGGTPHLYEIEPLDESFYVKLETFPTTQFGMGTWIVPGIEKDEEYYLSSGTIETVELSDEELNRLLEAESAPVRLDGQLQWTSDVNIDEL
jgi:hypothetical protein